MCLFIIVFSELHSAVEEKACRVVELEQELEVLEGELSAAQQAAKQAPSRTMKALVERLRNQLTMKEKQHRVSDGERRGSFPPPPPPPPLLGYGLYTCILYTHVKLR